MVPTGGKAVVSPAGSAAFPAEGRVRQYAAQQLRPAVKQIADTVAASGNPQAIAALNEMATSLDGFVSELPSALLHGEHRSLLIETNQAISKMAETTRRLGLTEATSALYRLQDQLTLSKVQGLA
jgi:hypothetical protein